MTAAGARTARHVRFDPDIAFRARARWIVEALEPSAGDLILDAGCGLGFYLALLSEVSAAAVVGVEIDRARLSMARGRPGLNRVQGDVVRLPFRDSTFDKVLVSEVLEHLPDDAAALSELHRVLKPDGVLAITVPHNKYPFLWDPVNWLRERAHGSHFRRRPWSGIWTDHVRLYGWEDLSRKVSAAGLAITSRSLLTRWSFPFAHLIVYEIGRLVAERSAAFAGSREAVWQEGGQSFLLRTAIRAFTALDHFNVRNGYQRGPAVSLCLRAVRPDEPT